MRKIAIMILSLFVMLTFVGCERQKSASEVINSLPPSIMVDKDLYTTTGQVIPIEPAEGEIKAVIG